MRPSQEEVLKQIEPLLGSKKFILLEAPVGFGKSAIAAAVCKYLGSAHILTATKQLQDQYSFDFGFPMVKGKPNFRCYVPTTQGTLLPCNKGRCEVDWQLKDCPHYLTFEEYDEHARKLCSRDSKCEHLKGRKLCTYYEQKWSGFRDPITVYNYSFLLSELKFAKNVPHRRLLVCDEVHDLGKQLVSFAAFTLKKSNLQYYHDEIRPEEEFVIPNKGTEDPAAWLDTLVQVGEMLEEFLGIHSKADAMQDRIAVCKKMLESIDSFTEDLGRDKSNWIVNSLRMHGDGSIEEVVFQPLNVGAYASSLFSIADTILMMSATISSKERLCRELGIDESESHMIQIGDSSFPIESRAIRALDVAQLNRASMDASLEPIARAVDQIMENHAGERGVIHTTSYVQARYIIEHVSESNRRRLVTTEGSFDRSTLLQIHSRNDSSVLISPSLYQGVDLKDDLSRFQIIVKVPYPDLSERRTQVKLQRDRDWYEWQTAQRLVQTYGRSVRSEKDHAITYVLDSNFARFVFAHRTLFPKYFIDAVKGSDKSLTYG